MKLRMPSSGSLVEVLFDRLLASPTDAAGDTSVDDVTESELVAALQAMARGDIEYVGLDSGDQFLQVAGTADGPYTLQMSDGRGGVINALGSIDAAATRRAMAAYLRGDPAWQSFFPSS